MGITETVNQAGGMVIGGFMRAALRLDVARHGSLPQGAKLIAANHPTTADPFYLLSLVNEPMYLLVTEMAFNDPALGGMLRAAGHIEVKRGNGRAAFDQGVERLRGGSTVGIFPEGALSPREGGVGAPKTGTVRMALAAGVPIVPVGIHLDRSLIRYVEMTRGEITETARWYLQGPYAITVGEPMVLDGEVEDREYVRAMSEELVCRIAALAAEGEARMAGRVARTAMA